MTRTLVTLFLCFTLIGCKTSDEKLVDACISKLEKSLTTWAKYEGWSTSKVQGKILQIEPAIEKNKKFNADFFYNFEVIMTGFTVKNGFNTDVKSISSCTGVITKDNKGEYDPPSEFLIDLTLNGQKLGL